MIKSFLIAMVMLTAGFSTAQAQNNHAAWEALRAYDGVWLSDVRTRDDGSTFQFRYTLEPYDSADTIVEMTIEMLAQNEAPTLILAGYKGWDAYREIVYYHAISPNGRFADGDVVLEDGGNVVTRYRGVSQQQGENQIRDVITPIIDDRFSAVTYILRDGDWVEVWRDEWTRAG